MDKYRVLTDNEEDEAFSICFSVFSKCTEVFKQDFKDIDNFIARDFFIMTAKNYHREHNTTLIGCYRENKLIGVIEMNKFYINILAVDFPYQHLGIGYNLFLEAIKDKNDGDSIYVDADKNAIKAYKSWGFSSLENEDNKTCKMIYIISKDKIKEKNKSKII